MDKKLRERAGEACELCRSTNQLEIYYSATIPPQKSPDLSHAVLACGECFSQLQAKLPMNEKHWGCLSECIWSEVDAVKVVTWRVLNHFKGASWSQDLMEQLYLDEATLSWAKSVPLEASSSLSDTVTKDNFGNVLIDGDSVTLIKDLDVKGANFTAKRGTLVKNISLTNDPGFIEGRVNGVHIVLVTKFLKKA